MKIIFLDFYGVMDGSRTSLSRSDHLDPAKGALIAELCERANAHVVITSDAVQYFEETPDCVPHAVKMLVECGVPEARIAGYTHYPSDSISITLWDRPGQIRTWLNDHPEVTHFVIFDDMPLPFTKAMLEDRAQYIGRWEGKEPDRAKWIERLPDPDPEAARCFVHITSEKPKPGERFIKTRLQRNHIERAFKILTATHPPSVPR